MSNRFPKEKLTIVSELIYEIKIAEAMTKKVIYFHKNVTFRKIQTKMKEKKISGVPILDNQNKIIGIISIDDVIAAFDKNYIDENISKYMTKNVITVPQNFSIISAIHKFEKFKVGRLPVTESLNCNKIVGIITISDILNRLLVVTQSIADQVEDKELGNLKKTISLSEAPSKKYFKFKVSGDDFDNAGQAASISKRYFMEGIFSRLMWRDLWEKY